MALDGLQRFDKKHGYDIFANDEFLDECEEIEAMLPESNKEKEESHNEATKQQFEKPAIKEQKPEQKTEPKQEVKSAPVEEVAETQQVPKTDISDRLAALRAKSKK